MADVSVLLNLTSGLSLEDSDPFMSLVAEKGLATDKGTLLFYDQLSTRRFPTERSQYNSHLENLLSNLRNLLESRSLSTLDRGEDVRLIVTMDIANGLFEPEEKGKLPLIFGAIACGLCGVSALFWLFTLLPAEVGFRIDRPTAVPFLIIIFWLLNLAVLAFIILRHRQIAAQPETVPSAPPAPAQSAPKQTGGYYERDNVGTRQDTVSQANAYWLGERFKMPVKPPFTLFTMPSKRAAEEVLLSLPFMHRAKDSGKIICDRIMTYGVYETTLNGKPTGEYEVLITGFEFTLDEYNKAEEGFTKRGGKCKSHEAPDASVTVDTRKGDASKVRYKETVRGKDGVSTYEVYSAPDKASATAFLKTKPVTRKLYYIVVDTPEGSFGRDINGFYQE